MRTLVDAILFNSRLARYYVGKYAARYQAAGRRRWNPYGITDAHPVSYAAAMSHMPKHAAV